MGAVNSIKQEIPMNRIVAIYGHHGNGKTRILNFVCELIRENEGESLSISHALMNDKLEKCCKNTYRKQVINLMTLMK